jgi:hypothetical protein
MKIEICEQMVQSWLINCKNCQIAQTNWSISPLKDIDAFKSDIEAYIDHFVDALKNGVAKGKIAPEVMATTNDEVNEAYNKMLEGGETISFMSFCAMFASERKEKNSKEKNIDFSNISILGKAGKAKAVQFIRQTEIDILGVELDNGVAKNIYLIDTAYHKDGLNYGDTVSAVTKKIIRAVLVADIIFGTDVPVHIVFASPECKPGPQSKIQAVKGFLEPYIENRPTLKGKNSKLSVELYMNADFSTEIYLPLKNEIDKLFGGNDLFMRALNLAKISESNLSGAPAKASSSASSGSATTPKKKTSGRAKYTEDDMYKEAAYYLKNNGGLPEVEKVVLGCNNNGSNAKGHLNALGVDTSRGSKHKGLLSHTNIDDAIAHATDTVFKNTLEEIKKRELHKI